MLFNKFFSIVDICLSCEDTARQSCEMVLMTSGLETEWAYFGRKGKDRKSNKIDE